MLSLSSDPVIIEWALGSMAAAGYSYSHAIVEGSVENRIASRRVVVFALEPKTEAHMTRQIIETSFPGTSDVAQQNVPRKAIESAAERSHRITDSQLPSPVDYLKRG